VRDPVVMRAMAHPARLAILERLSRGSTATATECAQLVGLSPSATSYHLRALARAGLVEEAPNRGDGRERVWRGVPFGLSIVTSPDDSAEEKSAAHDLWKVMLAWDQEQLDRFFRQADSLPQEWNDAAGITRAQLVMTAEEVSRLFAEVNELFNRYGWSERPAPPPGARRVGVLFRAVPIE
jgi:DNA-binding transcriptional ArsR family regulator